MATRPIIVKLLTALLQALQRNVCVLMEKEEMTDVELLVDIRKASSGRPADLANWPNHRQKLIVPACKF